MYEDLSLFGIVEKKLTNSLSGLSENLCAKGKNEQR